MIRIAIGFILGVMVCTVGLSGVFKMFDNGVQKVQEVSKEASK